MTFRRVLAGLMLVAAMGSAAEVVTTRAELRAVKDRTPAARFALKDASGKTVKLEKYRGKVVLLDFWATWCTGCKEEIPWFSEFEKKYGKQGFAVVGVSMDEDGWKVLRPFLAEHTIPYKMVLGDEGTAKQYGIANLPDTFLIDKEGRVAAAYTAGLVNRDDAESHILALLAGR